jgi:hypothetical protein
LGAFFNDKWHTTVTAAVILFSEYSTIVVTKANSHIFNAHFSNTGLAFRAEIGAHQFDCAHQRIFGFKPQSLQVGSDNRLFFSRSTEETLFGKQGENRAVSQPFA